MMQINETRENLERMTGGICYHYNYYKPRMYREKARKDYLNLAKCKKRTAWRSADCMAYGCPGQRWDVPERVP